MKMKLTEIFGSMDGETDILDKHVKRIASAHFKAGHT